MCKNSSQEPDGEQTLFFSHRGRGCGKGTGVCETEESVNGEGRVI